MNRVNAISANTTYIILLLLPAMHRLLHAPQKQNFFYLTFMPIFMFTPGCHEMNGPPQIIEEKWDKY